MSCKVEHPDSISRQLLIQPTLPVSLQLYPPQHLSQGGWRPGEPVSQGVVQQRIPDMPTSDHQGRNTNSYAEFLGEAAL